MKAQINSPTLNQVSTLEEAFDLLNKTFFENKLPCVIINQQHRKSEGYFVPNRWKNKKDAAGQLHEINLNPAAMNRDNKMVLSTLLHEMVHLWQWQYCEGRAQSSGYHNQEWADKMISVGLQPIAFDNVHKTTGWKINHTVIKDGPFDKLINESSFMIKYYSPLSNKNKDKAKKNKVKYTCFECDTNIWGKPGLHISCGNCNYPFIEEKPIENPETKSIRI